MLVITRKNNEELIIGGDIRVRIVAIRGQRVQLGIEAPLDISVRRCEPSSVPDWNDAEACVTVEAH